jgi:hypothetical protein
MRVGERDPEGVAVTFLLPPCIHAEGFSGKEMRCVSGSCLVLGSPNEYPVASDWVASRAGQQIGCGRAPGVAMA